MTSEVGNLLRVEDDEDIFGEIEKEEKNRNKTPLRSPIKEEHKL